MAAGPVRVRAHCAAPPAAERREVALSWRNRYTRRLQVAVPVTGMRVRLPPRAPPSHTRTRLVYAALEGVRRPQRTNSTSPGSAPLRRRDDGPAPWCGGQAFRPLTAAARVRIPPGTPHRGRGQHPGHTTPGTAPGGPPRSVPVHVGRPRRAVVQSEAHGPHEPGDVGSSPTCATTGRCSRAHRRCRAHPRCSAGTDGTDCGALRRRHTG